MPLVALLAGQLLGVMFVGGVMFPLVLRLTLQPPAIIPILVVLSALSSLIVALTTRLVGGALGPYNLAHSLSREAAS